MQKILIGILGLLVIYLAAVDVRLQQQARRMEERLAAAEKRPARAATAANLTGAPSAPPAESDPLPPSATIPSQAAPSLASVAADPVKVEAPAPASEPLQLAGKELTFTLNGDQATLVRVGGDEDLGLNATQLKAVAELRKSRDLQTQSYSELIQRIDEQTEQSIRSLLSPEQLEKYDAQHPQTVTATTFDPQVPQTLSGLKPGYLGISGADAEGGGARVTQVFPNTAASAFGLQKDDVILEFNGQPVPQLSALSGMIRETGEGLAATLRIRRGGNELYQSVQLGAWPK
jgi:hypothetical protein